MTTSDPPSSGAASLEIGFLNLAALRRQRGGHRARGARAAAAPAAPGADLGDAWARWCLRLLFVGVVSALLRVPLLRLVGGGLLLSGSRSSSVRPVGDLAEAARHGTSFWEAIWIIVVADLTMSLDNVLAIAAAAHGDLLLVGLGIAMSLPSSCSGATSWPRLMNRHAWIIWLGGGILGYVAARHDARGPAGGGSAGALATALEHAVPLATGSCSPGGLAAGAHTGRSLPAARPGPAAPSPGPGSPRRRP